MIDIQIGVKRQDFLERLREAEREFLQEEVSTVEFVLYGKTNDARNDDVTITFSNDDMERVEVPVGTMYVDVSGQ